MTKLRLYQVYRLSVVTNYYIKDKKNFFCKFEKTHRLIILYYIIVHGFLPPKMKIVQLLILQL